MLSTRLQTFLFRPTLQEQGTNTPQTRCLGTVLCWFTHLCRLRSERPKRQQRPEPLTTATRHDGFTKLLFAWLGTLCIRPTLYADFPSATNRFRHSVPKAACRLRGFARGSPKRAMSSPERERFHCIGRRPTIIFNFAWPRLADSRCNGGMSDRFSERAPAV